MKTAFKWIFRIMIVLVILVGGFVAWLKITGIPTYTPQNITLSVESTPERIEKGEKLISMLCKNCHYSDITKKMTGAPMLDMPSIFGSANSLNITQDKDKGIGGWSDGELVYFLRTGIRKNGTWAPPWMPKFNRMSNEDLFSVVSFLKSGSELVQAAKEEPLPGTPSLFALFLCHVAFKPMTYKESVPQPDATDSVKWGKYLAVDVYDCFSCHSADFATNDFESPEKSAGFFGGGNKTTNKEGQVLRTANITMDTETGIGNWTEDQFITALKWGKSPTAALRYPMVPFSRLDTVEVRAIFSYLKTVPPIKNKVDRGVQ